MDQGLALLLNPSQTCNLDLLHNSPHSKTTDCPTQPPAGETSQSASETINGTLEPIPQGHQKKWRRTTTRNQRAERKIIDSLNFQDPAKYQEWLNTPAYNKRGPLTQKQDEWLWSFTGADCFGKVDWPKCAHLYFQLFDEKRTAGRLQMEWFRISRNKRNEAEQVVAAEEKQKPLGCLPVLIPKLDPPIRNARKRRATADEIKPSKDEVVATQVADTAHRKTNKRRRDTPDDERPKPLFVRIKPGETSHIGEIVGGTCETMSIQPLALDTSHVRKDDQSSTINTGIYLGTEESSMPYLTHCQSRDGRTEDVSDVPFGHEEPQSFKQAGDISMSTLAATHYPTLPGVIATSSIVEYPSIYVCELPEDQARVRNYSGGAYVHRGLDEQHLRQMESKMDMFSYWTHNHHKSFNVPPFTDYTPTWAKGKSDPLGTSIWSQAMFIKLADSTEEMIATYETIERARQIMGLDIGLLLDPELIGVPPSAEGLLDLTGAVAYNQLSQQVSTGTHGLRYPPTQDLARGINLTNPSQSHTRPSGFEKSLNVIFETLLDTPIDQDIVLATDSDYTIWSVTTPYAAQQVSSEPENEGNSASAKELIRRVKAIIRSRETVGSTTEFQ